MPHGTPRAAPYSAMRRTAMRQVSSSSVSGKRFISSSGIRYSNAVPLQDSSVGVPETLVTSRPRWNQCASGISPLAIAMKLARRASEASRS